MMRKIEEIVDGAIARLKEQQQWHRTAVEQIAKEAEASVKALLAFGDQLPKTLDVLLDRCAGGRTFMVKEVEVSLPLGEVSVNLGNFAQVRMSDGSYPLIPPPAGTTTFIAKYQVVLMLMPVVENKTSPEIK